MKPLLLSLICCLSGCMLFAQNVGIGTSVPQYKLDVAGRVRIRNNPGQTAGIFYDGPTLPVKAFIGMVNDTTVGIYGDASAWTFAMNTESGNVGIGTTLPTAQLDINGTMRMRGDLPKKGSLLTSKDNLGNAGWADPVAFRVAGLSGGSNQSIPKDTWTKIMFNTSATYNAGLNYQSFLSQFLVGENGVYHFDSQLSFDNYVSVYRGIRLMLNRNGNISTLMQQNQNEARTTEALVLLSLNAQLAFEGQLLAGDVVWIEINIGPTVMNIDNGQYVNSAPLLTNSLLTFFSGHLVYRL